jgi:hypothetical protein
MKVARFSSSLAVDAPDRPSGDKGQPRRWRSPPVLVPNDQAQRRCGASPPKAMPVLLPDREARETWMEGSIEEALALQGPAAEDAVQIVATGAKQDGGLGD